MGEKLFGASIKRREDPRLITGKGTFVDDVRIPGTTTAAFVRSPHAHARIVRIDATAAKKVKGVLAVYTGKDLVAAGVKPIPVGWLIPNMKIPPRYPLAVERARHMGEAVAVVIAESPYIARDAAELVEVEYEPLPVVSDAAKAVQPGAPAVHDDARDNVSFRWQLGDKAATDKAFAGASRIVKQSFRNHRLIPNAIEPRAALANANPGTGEVTLWLTTQNPHVHRLLMAAFVLGMPEHKLRVISPDVGGGFGSKIFVYPEECVVTWASRALSRPVKWTADRRESFLTDAHGRDHYSDAEMALSEDGRILGLRVKTIANMGAYLSLFAPCIPTYLYGTLLAGAYRTPAIHVDVTAVFTNTTPVDAYRGAGRPEACYLVERMVDLAARELAMDPLELRRKNFISKDQFPYQTPVALLYDSGNYEAALDKALESFDYGAFRKEQEQARKQGRYLGVGFSTYVEACGLAPSQVAGALGAQAGLYESATVRVHPTGKVTVFTGSHSHGQGHETTFAQVAADELQVPFEDVEIVHGDTALMAYLAHNMPKNLAPGLEAISCFDPGNFVFPFGTHVCVVEVARDTGQVKVVRYLAVDDLGRVINPMIVDGMVHGGIAQGVSQALWEHAEYDENGQLVTGSFMNYAMPHADDLPSFQVGRTETPTPVNPLGVKGAGETGTIASTAAVAYAVMDALSPFGIRHIDMPLTPDRLWEALRGR